MATQLFTVQQATDAYPDFANLSNAEQSGLIDAISSAVEQHCRRSFSVQTYTEYLNGVNRSRVWLEHTPVVSVTSVVVDGQTLDNTSGNSWIVEPGTGELLRGNGQGEPRLAPWWPVGRRNITVVYTAGYSSVPADVTRAAVLWLTAIKSQTGGGIFKSEKLGAYEYQLADPGRMPPMVAKLLSPYAAPDPIW